MLENLKIKLVKVAKDAEKYNLCSENTGSFSIRDKISGYVIITPSKIKIEELNEDQIFIVDLKGKIIKGIDGNKPHKDMFMHLGVYKERDDIRSLMHVYPTYVSTFSVANKVIPPITYDSANYGGYVYVANCKDMYENCNIKELIEKLSISDACMLESNGVVVTSGDIEHVLSKARSIERVAEIYYKSLILNKFDEPKRFTREELTSYRAFE